MNNSIMMMQGNANNSQHQQQRNLKSIAAKQLAKYTSSYPQGTAPVGSDQPGGDLTQEGEEELWVSQVEDERKFMLIIHLAEIKIRLGLIACSCIQEVKQSEAGQYRSEGPIQHAWGRSAIETMRKDLIRSARTTARAQNKSERVQNQLQQHSRVMMGLKKGFSTKDASSVVEGQGIWSPERKPGIRGNVNKAENKTEKSEFARAMSEGFDVIGGGSSTVKNSIKKEHTSLQNYQDLCIIVLIICYLCGQEFSRSSFGIHLKNCTKRWMKDNPKGQIPSLPYPFSQLENINEQSLKTLQKQEISRYNYLIQQQFESQLSKPAAVSYGDEEAQKRRVRSSSLRGVVPSILSSNLKKKRDELLNMESSMVSIKHARQTVESRSQSKNNGRLIFCDSQNAVQIFIPGNGSGSLGQDFTSPMGQVIEEEKITLSRQREIDNNSSMDVETQMVDNLKLLKHENSATALHQINFVRTVSDGKVFSEQNSPKKRKEWNTARVIASGRNLMVKPPQASGYSDQEELIHQANLIHQAQIVLAHTQAQMPILKNDAYLDLNQAVSSELQTQQRQKSGGANLNATHSQQTIRYSAANNITKQQDFFGASISQQNQSTPFAIVNLKKGNQSSNTKPSKKETGDNYFTGIKQQNQRTSAGLIVGGSNAGLSNSDFSLNKNQNQTQQNLNKTAQEFVQTQMHKFKGSFGNSGESSKTLKGHFSQRAANYPKDAINNEIPINTITIAQDSSKNLAFHPNSQYWSISKNETTTTQKAFSSKLKAPTTVAKQQLANDKGGSMSERSNNLVAEVNKAVAAAQETLEHITSSEEVIATRRRLRETSALRKQQLQAQGYSTSNEYRDHVKSPQPISSHLGQRVDSSQEVVIISAKDRGHNNLQDQSFSSASSAVNSSIGMQLQNLNFLRSQKALHKVQKQMMIVDLVDESTVKAIDCMSPSSFANHGVKGFQIQSMRTGEQNNQSSRGLTKEQYANQHSRTSSLQIKAHSTSSPSKRLLNNSQSKIYILSSLFRMVTKVFPKTQATSMMKPQLLQKKTQQQTRVMLTMKKATTTEALHSN